ncbi:hypothetical protein [[Limnothrix rosea] IAM M-220]|nr:hypothetical protein [[Limnothrix rosea] IAM M-220]
MDFSLLTVSPFPYVPVSFLMGNCGDRPITFSLLNCSQIFLVLPFLA